MSEKINRYDAVRETWRKRFLEMDCERLAERFHLEMDEQWLYLTYFFRKYGISRADGEIVWLDAPNAPVSFNTAMVLYNMFHYAVEKPTPSGKLVPFREVRRAYPFESAYRKSILIPLAERFNGHAEELRHAFENMHAQMLGQGDVGGKLEILPGLSLSVIFWDGDDEFPAQANMLFDYNITDYMHEENVVLVASDAAAFLAEAAHLPVPDHLMGAE